MSIASEITRLLLAKADIKTAIENKGVTVDASAKLDVYPDYIAQIPQGGGEYEPICFTSLEDGNTFKLNKKISISVDGKQTWQTLGANTDSPVINTGEKIYFRATDDAEAFAGTSSNYYNFMTAKTCNVSGHPYSLYAKGSLYFFKSLFNGTKIVDASELDLSEDIRTSYCYAGMFNGCTSLTTPPELPATTLATGCYTDMFNGCTSLTTPPELPATTIAERCYDSMFKGCTSLTTPPELPATTLASQCYSNMFSGCTSLTTAPDLPATTLASNCYQNMFSRCTSLTAAPELPATTLANYCYNSMFYGCTRLTTAPALPATTLVFNCYNSMFSGCTSLTAAPELPATTLANYCYEYMFQGCTSLNYIKALFTTEPSNTYTQNWVSGVAATGTFVKNSAATWTTVGTNAVPSGWTVETAS